MGASDLVIASTTDNDEQIKAALSHGLADAPADEPVLAEVDGKTGEPIVEKTEEKKPAAKATPEATEKAEKPAEKTEKPAEAAEAKPEDKPADKAPSRNEKRIAQLTAEKYTQMRRADSLQAQVEELTKRLDAKPEPKAEPTEVQDQPEEKPEAPEPTPDKFKTYEEYVKALGEWSAQRTVKAALAAERTRVQQETAQTQAQVAQTRFDEARVEASQRYNDFEETMQSDVAMAMPVSDAMQYVIMHNALGHDIAYHLVKNPEEAEAIAKLDGPDQVFAMGELAARVKSVLDGMKGPAAKAEKAAEKPEKKPVSTAPPPIEPVGAHATMSTVADDDLPWDEWKTKRNKQEAERRKARR